MSRQSHAAGTFPRVKNPCYALNRELGGPHNRSALWRRHETFATYRSRTPSRIGHYTDWANPTPSHIPEVFITNVCLFVCFPGVTTHCGCIFHSPVAGFSLLISRFLDHTQRRATVGRTPLDEWSIRRRDLYLTTHNTHNRRTSMPPVGFETTISAGERP
jgi:hypothetical protein